MLNSETAGLVLVLTATICLSTEAIAAKIAYREGAGVITTLAMRYVIAALAIWLWLIFYRQPWKLERRLVPAVAALAMGGHALSVLSLFYAFKYIPAATAILLLYVYPSVVTLLAYFFLKEQITWRKLLALGLTMAGCVIILGQPENGVDMRGVLLALTAAVINAVYLVGSTRLISNIPVVLYSGYVTGFTAFLFVILGVGGGGLNLAVSVKAWEMIVFLAMVCTVVPVITFFRGIKRIGASRSAIISTFEPVSTALLGIWLLQETLDGSQVLGGVLIVVGVLLQKRG